MSGTGYTVCAAEAAEWTRLLAAGAGRLWTYVPAAAFTDEADEEHPICQTYVDTVPNRATLSS